MNIDINQTNAFINRVFVYYNRRINIIIPAKLIIDWVNNGTIAGTSSNPNIVYIYPTVALNNSDNNIFTFYYLLLETIIHELFHIDQKIDYFRLKFDKKYQQEIESAVETQTALYIMGHRIEILEQFGMDITITQDHYEKIIYANGSKYYRKTYLLHVLNILSEILAYAHKFEEKSLVYIAESIYNKNGVIIICINGNELKLQDYNNLVDIDTVNNFFYNNYFYGNYRVFTKVDINIEKTQPFIYINIEAKIRNIMVERI